MYSLRNQLFGKNNNFLYALESDNFIYGLNRHVELPILKKAAIIQQLKKHKSKCLCKIKGISIEKHVMSAIIFFMGLKRKYLKNLPKYYLKAGPFDVFFHQLDRPKSKRFRSKKS